MAKEKKEEQKIPLENQPEQIIEVEVERLREFKGHQVLLIQMSGPVRGTG